MQMFNAEHLQEKWAPLLDYQGLDGIKDSHRRMVTAVLLENQEKFLREERQFLGEASFSSNAATAAGTGFAGQSTVGGPVAGFDPVLISLIRRSMPNLVAYDLAGVQPMNGPTGLIFAMRSRYVDQTGAEAFFDEVDSGFSGRKSTQTQYAVDPTVEANVGFGTTAQTGSNPGLLTSSGATQNAYNVGGGMATFDAERLGASGQESFNEMAFSIEKVTVTAKSRALKAEYSLELAQDLKAIHGLNAEAELANILSTEILAEINREVIRTIYGVAKLGAQVGTTTRGIFDLDTDSNGRWMVEKIKGLAFQIEREANTIAKQTRRGKGNIMLCSSDVASALSMAGILDYQSALQGQVNLTVDDTGNTFAGTLFGRIKVYIDPYFPAGSTNEFAVIGYKGSNAYDAGLFYCPYVPLQMVRAVDTGTFQPKIGFKTRYGLVSNPFADGTAAATQGALTAQSNVYYRGFVVKNLM